MNYELFKFALWAIDLNNLKESLLWFAQKFTNHLRNRINNRYSNHYYPQEIKDLYELTKNSNPHRILIKSEETSVVIQQPAIVANISLASIDWPIENNCFNWDECFDDSEDTESLHRWNWILTLISSDQRYTTIQLSWILSMQEDWVRKYQNEIYDGVNRCQKDLLRWNSYTVGERVANSILFYHLTKVEPTFILNKALIEQTRHLVSNLEYFGDNTGNHVFNNVRAIYLAGVFYECKTWCKLAEAVCKRELPLLVSQEGFMREGSSHYQFLFTRWVLEILHFAYLYGDHHFKLFLMPYVKILLNQCSFFQVASGSSHSQIILFGDISPDFPPDWLKNLTQQIVSYGDNCLPSSSWSRLWRNGKKPLALTEIPQKSHYQSEGIYAFPESGWFRFNYNKYSLLMRADEEGIPPYVGHHHQDAGHFCLYYRNLPVFVDGGRLNYQDSYGVTPAAHNSLTLDKKGLVPLQPRKYPRGYGNCRNKVNYHKGDNEFTIIFESNGFKRLESKLFWRRSITLRHNEVRIQDFLEGKKHHSLSTWFHWDAEAEVTPDGNDTYFVKLGQTAALFKIHSRENMTACFHLGGSSPLGWQTVAYGKQLPAVTLEINQTVQLPETLEYSLVWL